MDIIDIFLLALGVAMDAFAVSIAKGLSLVQATPSKYMSVGLWFGGFQALMPLLGYFVGIKFAYMVASYDHWIAFILLAAIGGKMLWDAIFKRDEEELHAADFSPSVMLMLAIATSIDALAVGVSLAFLDVNITTAIFLMGTVTFALSAAGLKIGYFCGCRFKSAAEITGGVVLVFLGTKILISHLLGYS